MDIEEIETQDEDQETNDSNSENDDNNETSANKTDNSPTTQDDEKSFKQRYSDSSREGKRIANVHNSYRSVLQDNSKLLDLDKDIAKDVVAQLYEDGYSTTDDYDELVKIINGESGDISESSNQIDEKELAKKIRQEIVDENNKEAADKILEKSLSKYDQDVKDKYLQEFKETVGKRKITPALAEKEIKKIILYYSSYKTSKNKSDDALSKLASNNLGGTKTKSSTTMTTGKLDMMGMPLDRQKSLYPELFPNNK